MGELLKECLLVKLVEETRWREIDKWQHPQTLPTVVGCNLPTFGVMIPQESGIKADGSINDN